MSDVDDELGFEPPPEPDHAEPLELVDAEGANRMMRRLRHTEREIADTVETAAADIAQTSAWRDKRVAGLESTRRWCLRSLEGFARLTHARTGRQSVTLPAGKVQLRKRARRYEIPKVETAEQAAAWTALGEGIVTPTWKLGAKAAQAVIEPGPALGEAEDGYVPHRGLAAGGVVLEGVIVYEPTDTLGFSATPAASIEDLDAEIDDAVRLEPPSE